MILKISNSFIRIENRESKEQRRFSQSLSPAAGDCFQKSSQPCVPFMGSSPEVPEEIELFSKIYKFADPEEMYFLYTECERGNLEQEHFYRKAPKNSRPIKPLSEDIKLVQQARANNIALIDAYIPKVDDIQSFYKKAQVGDVFEYNDRLAVVKDEKGAIYLDIEKEDYFELFPPIQRFINHQGKIGDCYLVADLMRMYKNPYGRAELLQCFSREGGDISIKFPKADEPVAIKGGKLPSSVEKKHLLKGAKGLQMLEYAYGVALAAENAKKYEDWLSVRIRDAEFNSDQDTADKLQRELDAFMAESKKPDFDKYVPGFASRPISIQEAAKAKRERSSDPDIHPYKTTAEFLRGNGSNPFLYGWLFGISNKIFDGSEFFEVVKEDIGQKNISYVAGTIKDLSQIKKDGNFWDLGIEAHHAYELTPLDDGTFNIVNPHNTGFEVNLSQDEFGKFFLNSENSYISRANYRQD